MVCVYICWIESIPYCNIETFPPQWDRDTTNWQLLGQGYSLYPGIRVMFALQWGYYNVRWYVRGKWTVRDISTILYNTQETLHDNICTAKNVFSTLEQYITTRNLLYLGDNVLEAHNKTWLTWNILICGMITLLNGLMWH